MNSLFLDTSFIVALNATDDQAHERASACWSELKSSRPRLITTSFVLDEVATMLNKRGLHGLAVQIGQQLMQSSTVKFVHVERRLLDQGWLHFCSRADKRYSLTDCISFVVMGEQGISQALTFDQHFLRAGFEMLPGT